MKKHNWIKPLIQWGVIAYILYIILRPKLFGGAPADVEAYCPFGGLQALGSYLKNNSLACSMSMAQIAMGLALGVGIILLSKLFCGYLCPVGTLSETMGKLGRKMHCNTDINSGSIVDRALRVIKYVLLFTVFYFTLQSSELFCKNFDPYYAMATGFKGEITMWMTIISLTLLFLGSLFVRGFWCKYICPLGALSNIFKYTITLLVIVLACWLTGIFSTTWGWAWVLGGTCLVSYIFEMVTLRASVFPIVKIRRDATDCNKCGLCQKKCPYNIPVQKMTSVKHIDCTLCSTCVSACPKECLTVAGSKKLRWLPAVMVVVLVALGIIVGTKFELPTIDEKWGEWEQVEGLQTFEMSGLTTIKCFGSSKAFSAKMQAMPGVYGVKTFVRSHTINVLYDPKVIDEDKLKEALFAPTIRKYSNPEEGVDTLKVITLGIEGLRDRNDVTHFGMLLQFRDGIYGFDAEYGCPVIVTLYVDPASTYNKDQLQEIIETKQFTYPPMVAEPKSYDVDFELKSYSENGTISAAEFKELMFTQIAAMKGNYTENGERWGGDEHPKAIYRFAAPTLEKVPVRQQIPYLKSYLSTVDGILSFEPKLVDGSPVIELTYATEAMDDPKLWAAVTAPTWTLRMSDGTFKDVEAGIKFETEGCTVTE